MRKQENLIHSTDTEKAIKNYSRTAVNKNYKRRCPA